jgi:hypothetical protein
MRHMGAELVKYSAMCRAIDAAYQVDEVKDIRDKAIALETYARQARNIDAERLACEIRIRAERKAGQLSAKLKKSKGGRPKKTKGTTHRVSKKEELEKAGISTDQAKQWEQLAKIADADFEKQLHNSEGKPTTNGLIRANAPADAKPRVASEALWVWGRLREFDRMIVPRKPEDVLFTLSEEMADDIHTAAPRVAAWLKRIK